MMNHHHADVKHQAVQVIVRTHQKIPASLTATGRQKVRLLNRTATVLKVTSLMAINHRAVHLPALTVKKRRVNHHPNHIPVARIALAHPKHMATGPIAAARNAALLINRTAQEEAHLTSLTATDLTQGDHHLTNLLTAGHLKLINHL